MNKINQSDNDSNILIGLNTSPKSMQWEPESNNKNIRNHRHLQSEIERERRQHQLVLSNAV